MIVISIKIIILPGEIAFAISDHNKTAIICSYLSLGV